MADARNSFEYFRKKNVQDIYSSEKEKHQTGSGWLRFLQDLPFEPDYSRKALKENRMPTKDVKRLQSWGRECHGSITEKVACVGEPTARDELTYCVKALHHLEIYLDSDTIEKLDQTCRSLWEVASRKDKDLSEVLAGLLCILLTHQGRSKTSRRKTFKWIVEKYLEPTYENQSIHELAKEAILRSVVAFSQALPEDCQKRLLLALGVSANDMGMIPRDMNKATVDDWSGKLLRTTKQSIATQEIAAEASMAIKRLVQWNNYSAQMGRKEVEDEKAPQVKPLIISFHSHKGGVGKTTLTLALSLKLAEPKKKVRIVDTDFMASSWAFFLDYENLDLETFVPIETFMSSYLEEGLVPENSYERMWRNIWAKPKRGWPKGSDVRISLTGPFAHKRSALVARLYTKDFFKIMQLYCEMVAKATTDQIDYLIFDNSPGLWGFSFVSLRQTIENRGLAVFVSSPDKHDMSGSLAQLAAIRDLAIEYPKHYMWIINRIIPNLKEMYHPVEIARTLSENPALKLFKNPDFAYRIIESKFWIVDTAELIEENEHLRAAYASRNQVDINKIREFAEGEPAIKKMYQCCKEIVRARRTD